ncbi:MAG: dUTP pyrophosphatase [Cyanobacteria bacterium P01_D01_bin.156]
MSFWSSQTLRTRISEEELIKPYNHKRVESASYGLSLGDEVYISALPSTPLDKRTKRILQAREAILIPPGQFAYLITEEVITVPEDAIAFISMRFSAKSKGLVNVSGFHVDPGYSGKLVFSVYNAGPLNYQIEYKQKLFTIWFASLDQYDDSAREKPGYTSISTDIVNGLEPTTSLPSVVERLNDLEKRIDIYSTKQAIIWGVVIAITLAVVNPIIKTISSVVFADKL